MARGSTAAIAYAQLARVFMRIGASSFGGWSTTAILLEKEFVNRRKQLTEKQIKGGVAYAQILPGATQVSLVANVGYQLKGTLGSVVATVCYLLPAVILMVLFAALYFHIAHTTTHLSAKLDGLTAALSGVILANAYKIGSRHARGWLWLLVISALLAKLWLGVNALLLIVAFGAAGLIYSWIRTKKASA